MLKDIAMMMNMTEDEVRNHPHLLINAFDHDHRVLFWNCQCEKYFGIKEKDALGKKVEDIVLHSRNNKKMEYLDKALSGQPVYVADSYDIRRGSYDQAVLPIKADDGKVIAAVNIVVDVGMSLPGESLLKDVE